MPKRNTTTKETSGLGYEVENDLAAFALASLLGRSHFASPPGGTVVRVQVQLPPSEWPLDDLVVTSVSCGQTNRVAFSAKSNTQITRTGLPADFVRAAWTQLLAHTSAAFDETSDYVGLAAIPLAPSLDAHVQTLLREARQRDPANLDHQVHLDGRANKTVVALHDSARCPVDLAAAHGIDIQTSAGRLLKRTLWLPFDVQGDGSVHKSQALLMCRDALVSGHADEAADLWDALGKTARAIRTGGGERDLPALLNDLRGRFTLNAVHDHRSDWNLIRDDAQASLDRHLSTIGENLELPRSAVHDDLRQTIGRYRAAVLLGDAGMGKTGVAKQAARTALETGPVLWASAARLDVGSLADWRMRLGLSHSLKTLASTVAQPEALLVLDSLDRLYSADAFDAAAEFLRATRAGLGESPWRLLATCTSQDWARVSSEFRSRGVPLPADSDVHVGMPDAAELDAVWAAFPELAILNGREHIADVLHRPAVLNLLASNRDILDDAMLLGESDVARIFWEQEVAPAGHGVGRAQAAQSLATRLADDLRTSVPEASLVVPSGMDALTALERARVVERRGGAIAFAHDLYADWVRVRTLLDEVELGTLPAFLADRARSPVWQRALRLLGIDLFEQGNDRTAWRRTVDTLSASDALNEAAKDAALEALLEAAAFSVKQGVGLLRDDVWSLLEQEDGRHLVRLLRRLAVSATVTNRALVRALARVDPELALAAEGAFRIPSGPYGYAVVSMLHRHRDHVPRGARGEVARAAVRWLNATAPGTGFRTEAAQVATALGDALLTFKVDHDALFSDAEPDLWVYRSLLASSGEEPQAVTRILLEAAGRRDRRAASVQPAPEKAAPREVRAHTFPPDLSDDADGPVPEPYLMGPRSTVDKALQSVLWSTSGLGPLAQTIPDVARELLLASLILPPQSPRRRSGFADLYDSREYGLEDPPWCSAFYLESPFLEFLKADESAAVDAILQLVDHALDQWIEAGSRLAHQDGLYGPVYLPHVAVWVDGQWVSFAGNSSVFCWSLSGPGRSNAVSAALSALEKHLYDLAEAEENLEPLVTRLLRDGRSLAILGVLALLVQRHPSLAGGALRGLAVSPEIAALVYGRAERVQQSDQLWLMDYHQLPTHLRQAHDDWHAMPHRKLPQLLDLPHFVAFHPALGSFFASARKYLLARLAPGGPYAGDDDAERIAVTIDLANYHPFTNDDGQFGVAYRPPEAWALRESQRQLERVQGLMLQALPELAAEAYAPAGARFTDLDAFLDGIAPDAPDALWHGHEHLEVARAALCLHPLRGTRSDDRRSWARARVLEASAVPNETPGLYSFVGNMMRDPVVLPHAVVALLCAAPGDEEVRRAVGRHLRISPPHDLVALGRSARSFTEALGDDHHRIVHALMRRAVVVSTLESAEQKLRLAGIAVADSQPPAEQLEAQIDASQRDLQSIEDGFADATLPPSVPALDTIAAPRPRPPRTWSKGRSGLNRRVDDLYLSVAIHAIPPPLSTQSPWYSTLVQLAAQTFGPLAQAAEESAPCLDGLPTGWESALLDLLAEAVGTSSHPDDMVPFWQPVLDIGAASSAWVEPFLTGVTRRVVVPASSLEALTTWKRMIRYALDHPAWSPLMVSEHRGASSWRTLLGLTTVVGVYEWKAELQPAVSFVGAEFVEWSSRYLADSSTVGWVAALLTFPAFESVAMPGLLRLHEAAQRHPSSFWGSKGGGESSASHVSSLLTHLWNGRRADIRAAPERVDAFKTLLRELVSRSHEDALLLSERVRKEGM